MPEILELRKELADPSLDPPALAFEAERAGIAVRQRMLNLREERLQGPARLAIEEIVNPLDQDGEVLGHGARDVVSGARGRPDMGRKAYLRPRAVLDRSGRWCPTLRRSAVALCAAAALAVTGAAEAGSDVAGSLETRLERALAVSGLPAKATGAVVVDLASGELVYSRNENRSLVPASIQKLTVAVTALAELGPGYRLETEVLGEGRQAGAVWQGDLVLKGYGDPTLDRRDLRELARQVRAAGIERVTRRVLGDESFFDDRRTAPGWPASSYLYESPPLSALVVDRGAVKKVVVENPALAAARLFRAALARAGVRVAGKAATGRASANAVPLAGVLSQKLSRIVRRMNRESDNFIAEMLVKGLGARAGTAGTTAAGAQVVRRALERLGVPLAGTRLVDGSGLSRNDRLTAQTLGSLLVAVWRDPKLKQPFVDSLAVAGINGTLEDRFEKGPVRGHVRAKTGTTDIASSLAGYVRDRFAFVILMNGSPIPFSDARRAQDRFVQLLAKQ